MGGCQVQSYNRQAPGNLIPPPGGALAGSARKSKRG